MELFNQRIENTANIIKLFKADQERLILKSHDDSKYRSKVRTSGVESGGMKLVDGAQQDSSNLMRIMTMDCVIMPFSQENKSYQKLWPQALIVNRSKNCAEVGLIESHGSLWRILPCAAGATDETGAVRVLLQTAVSTQF